ncbi:MAG: DcaP family trimeric outer membrane transporter [Pseudomonadota bacterium]
MNHKRLRAALMATVMSLAWQVNASEMDSPVPLALDNNSGMAEIIALLRNQQQELAAQRQRLDAQASKITALTKELDALRGAPKLAAPELAASELVSTEIQTSSRVINPTEAASTEDRVSETAQTEIVVTELVQASDAARSPAELDKVRADDPTKDLLKNFPGAWRLPGTSAALRVGGYVRTAIVLNDDVLTIPDRFIVGSIPVGVSNNPDNAAQSSITASQSRLDFDMREHTSAGILRAYVEGDFTGNGNTFRLRHAFGQWDRVLAGQTWSAFVDTEAAPEEVDFEGLNGRINVRQSQVRFSPSIGDNFSLELSLEDPNPQIQNGSGVSQVPDVVLAGKFQPNERLHLRAAVLGRQIRGQESIPTGTVSENLGGGVDKRYAWGLSVSGSLALPLFDSRNKLLFQLNQGNGLGRYVNDLKDIGQYDGIFNPNTNELQLFDVFAGYGSLQHWWGDTMRSNFTIGLVDVSNPNFVAGNAYKRTVRASANLLWDPTPRIETGLEYLWGRRENQNGEDGDAQQIQMMLRYLF